MVFYDGQGIFRRSVKHDSAVGYYYNPVAPIQHMVDVMGYNKSGQTFLFVKSGYQNWDLST